MILTESQVRLCIPSNKDYAEWTPIINEFIAKYDITTKERVACFIGQLAHESNNFSRLKENLNYSADGLRATFKKYYPTLELALAYARQPEKIANRVYANRMGNGSEASGDGWRHIGRGLIQLTGKENQTKFAEYIEYSLEDTIAYLETKQGAMHSACWYWTINNLNTYADKMDIRGLTKRINGGLIGIDERLARIQSIMKIL